MEIIIVLATSSFTDLFLYLTYYFFSLIQSVLHPQSPSLSSQILENNMITEQNIPDSSSAEDFVETPEFVELFNFFFPCDSLQLPTQGTCRDLFQECDTKLLFSSF